MTKPDNIETKLDTLIAALQQLNEKDAASHTDAQKQPRKDSQPILPLSVPGAIIQPTGILLTYIRARDHRQRSLLWSTKPYEKIDIYRAVAQGMNASDQWQGWVIPSLQDYIDTFIAVDTIANTNFDKESQKAVAALEKLLREDFFTKGNFKSDMWEQIHPYLPVHTSSTVAGVTSADMFHLTEYAGFAQSTTRNLSIELGAEQGRSMYGTRIATYQHVYLSDVAEANNQFERAFQRITGCNLDQYIGLQTGQENSILLSNSIRKIGVLTGQWEGIARPVKIVKIVEGDK